MSPPQQGIYKRAGQLADSVSPDGESFIWEYPPGEENASIGKGPAGEQTFRGTPAASKAVILSKASAISSISHHSSPDSYLALFFLTDLSGKTISNNNPPWLLGGPCCHYLFKYL